jgi:hypothetical protein
MNQILLQVLGVLETISTPIITLAAVWLGWRLSANSQRVQRRLDLMHDRLAALTQILKVVDNVPPDLGLQELASKFASDEAFRKSLVHRLVRLFGLRTELIASLDRELVLFIDNALRPLFIIGVGQYELHPNKVSEFAAAAFELRALTQRVEQRLVAEYEKLST